jgi:hypothetical protein
MIDYSQGFNAYCLAGMLVCSEVFLACILVAGILLIGHTTHFTVDPKGLHVQEIYFQGIKGKPVLFKKEEILRIYSNVKSEFPYLFIVYKRDGKKRIVGLDKSLLRDYDRFLCTLMELVPIINDGTWKYHAIKDAEKDKETNCGF